MDNIEYKSKKIEYDESSSPKLSVDGESIQVSLDKEANEYIAGELPYHTYSSLKTLAEAIVDQRVEQN